MFYYESSRIFRQVVIFNDEWNIPCTFNIPDRYSNLEFLGNEDQSVLVKAFDQNKNQLVMIKKVDRAFGMTISAKNLFREIVLMKSFRHKNIVKLLDAFSPNHEELYLVFEYLPTTLSDVIYSNHQVSKDLKSTVYQMLCAISYLHQSGITHKDLKPSSFGVTETGVVKLLNFGVLPQNDRSLTTIQTCRHYHSPEQLLGLEGNENNEKTDVWAIGCILAEMLNGTVLLPGEDTIGQIMMIMQDLGPPNEEFYNKMPQNVAKFIRSCVPSAENKTKIQDLLPTSSEYLDLLEKMLKIDPTDRISVIEALIHPVLHEHLEEERLTQPAFRFDDNLETTEKRLEEWKSLIFQEVRQFDNDNYENF